MDAIEAVVAQRDAAVKMLAEWCVAVDVNGSGWDDWDQHYKKAMYRETELPELRELLDAAIAKARADRESA